MKKLSVSNTGTNIKFVMLLLFFCFFFSKESYSQVLSQKDGIPIILFTEGPPDIPQNEVIKMKNLGVDIIHHTNVEDYMVERFVQSGLKVMPYQTWMANNFIYQYTNAHYTEWEAEGTAPDRGNVTLEHNSSISEFYFEDNTLKGIKTKLNAEAGNLIKGPGYRQTGHERYNDERPIIYDADFILKINSTDPNINLFEPQYQETVVCSIKVVSHGVSFDVTNDTMFISENPVRTFWREIKIKHFTDYNWNHLAINGYDWQEGGIPTLHPTEEEYFPTWKEPIYYEGQYVQFIVDWAGSNLLQLSVDKIVVSDEDGRNLMNPLFGAYDLIFEEVNSFSNPDAI